MHDFEHRTCRKYLYHPARVRKIMAKLHRAGLVLATEGRASGYCACKKAGSVTLAQIAQALDETPVAISWRPGDVDKNCMVSSGMAAVMDGVYAAMNGECRRLLATITVADITDRLSELQNQHT